MSTWVEANHLFERRGRVFLVGEQLLREQDINLTAVMNPQFMGDLAQAALDKLSEVYSEIVPAGSACIALKWNLDYGAWEFAYTHGSFQRVPPGEYFPRITLNYRDPITGKLGWVPDDPND